LVRSAHVALRTSSSRDNPLVPIRLSDYESGTVAQSVHQRSADFGLFTTGQVSTTFGSALTAAVLPVIAVEKFAADAWQIGLLHASSAVPVVFLGFMVGVWSDRRERKRLWLIVADIVSMVAIGGLCLGMATGVAGFYWILPVTFLFGILTLVAEALYFAHLETVIGDRTILQARSRLIAAERLGSSAGRGVSGALVWIGGYVFPLVVDLISFVVNAICLALIRSPDGGRVQRTESTVRQDMAHGFRLLVRIPLLKAFSTVGLLISVAEAMILAMLPILLLRQLGLPAYLYGLVLIASSAAAIGGAWVAPRIGERQGTAAVNRWGLLGIAAGMAGLAAGATLGSVPGLSFAVAGLAVLGFAGSMWNVGLTTLVTESADSAVLGRVSMNIRTLTALAGIMGAVAAGWIGETLGIANQLWIATAVGAVGVILMALSISRDDKPPAAPAEVRVRAESDRPR
ncbi:MFS transporter, partial [Nocardia sp. NPDC003345]